MATLVIEDGSIVTGANSYVTDAELVAFADSFGYDYNADPIVRCQQILKAMRYIEAHSKQFMGIRTSVGYGQVVCQPLSFPRCGVNIDGCDIPSDAIPMALKYAVMQTVIELEKGTPLWPVPVTTTSATITGAIKKKQVGPLVKEFHAPTSSTTTVVGGVNSRTPIPIAEVLQYLDCLFGRGAGGILSTRRV